MFEVSPAARDGTFVVVTLNLWRMRGNWRRRRWLVVRELRALDPDVIALQEVAPFRCQAQWLARTLSRGKPQPYQAWVRRKQGWRGLLEGIAVLSRLPADHRSFPLAGDRVAQALTLDIGGGRVTVYNTHLQAGGPNSDLRLRQARQILADADSAPGTRILAGDFNSKPDSRVVAEIEARGFRSAYRVANSAEATKTAPAGGPELLGNVLDYIFVDPVIEVRSTRIVFEQPSGQPPMYPSDHFGVAAWLDPPNQADTAAPISDAQ